MEDFANATAAECAARARPDIKLMEAQQVLAGAPETTRNAANPFKLKTRASHEGNLVDLAVIPDRVFGLDFTSDRKRKYFFLEADRATMPIVRIPRTSEHVFASAVGTPFTAWTNNKLRLDRLSGVYDWCIHDLRRTFSSKCAEWGSPHPTSSNACSGTPRRCHRSLGFTTSGIIFPR